MHDRRSANLGLPVLVPQAGWHVCHVAAFEQIHANCPWHPRGRLELRPLRGLAGVCVAWSGACWTL